MIRSTSMLPSFVYYVDYTNCTIQDALIHEFKKKGTLTLPDLNKIRVNGNCLVGSYGSAIMALRRKGYDIKMEVFHDCHKHITRSKYTLLNPRYCGSIED